MPRASRSYCKSTPISNMGFTQRSSCKAQGFIKRTGKSNKGKYLKSRQYKQTIRRRSPVSKRSPTRSKKRSTKRSKKTKSGKRRLISSRRGQRAKERVARASRGCSRQSTSKYMSRKSPPYPANNCCGMTKRGNDGNMYRSSGSKHCKWTKI